MAPPYDIISDLAQDRYYNNHEYNIVRLIFGKELPSDRRDENRYTRAADYFNTWLRGGILKQDPEFSIYLYSQDYLFKGGRKRRSGFIALVRLEDFDSRTILSHEETLPGPKADRFRLVAACQANFSSIFALYSDPRGAIERYLAKARRPLADLVYEDGVRHTLWAITDGATIDRIAELMALKEVFIADGHHRYEAALNFRNLRREQFGRYTGTESYNYTMVYFSNVDDPGITILPTHRLVRNLPGSNMAELNERLGEFFEIEAFEFGSLRQEQRQRKKIFEEMAARRRPASPVKRGERGSPKATSTPRDHLFGMYSGSNRYYLLALKDEQILDKVGDLNRSCQYRRLDTAILHSLILDRILGLGERLSEDDMVYTQDVDDAIQLVREGDWQIAFFLNPPRMSQVRDIALSGELMPSKSTYFYPKLLSGLVINRISD
jgi:uncharacterized protein (DUF1015 family)